MSSTMGLMVAHTASLFRPASFMRSNTFPESEVQEVTRDSISVQCAMQEASQSMNFENRKLELDHQPTVIAPRSAPPVNGSSGVAIRPSANGTSATLDSVLLNTPSQKQLAPPASGPITCDVGIPYCRVNMRWLAASVESILNQVGASCIVHLIADGFDDPDDPARKFADLPNVKWYTNTESIGPYRSVNRIADRLETPYLAIQDSDDLAFPHRIALSVEQLRQHGAEMFGAAMRQFTSYESRDRASEEYVRHQPLHRSGRYRWDVSPDGVVINGTRVLTVDLFRRMNGFAPLAMSADCEFTTRCLRAGVPVVLSEEIVALRRVHGQSLSRGRANGIGSRTRDLCHQQMKASYDLMKPGFDPCRFGGMDAELLQSHSTASIAREMQTVR